VTGRGWGKFWCHILENTPPMGRQTQVSKRPLKGDVVWQHMLPDKDGVSLSEQAYAHNCKRTMLRSESSIQVVVGVGLDNIMVVAMPDAVLAVDKNRSQEVNQTVVNLRSAKVPQAVAFSSDFRP